jgi:DNA polymerase-4
MHYYLYVEIPGLYVREWERIAPERAKSPLAIHRDKRLIDLNRPALDAGLKIGMGLDEAKVLLQGSGLVLFEEEPYRDARKEWLDRLSDFSSVIEPDEMHSAWADLTGHPVPLDIAAEIRKTFGYPINIGLAGTKWLAKLAADLLACSVSELWQEATSELLLKPTEFIAPLPTAFLLPVNPVTQERLKFLGYRTIGEVANIPLRTLKTQFGEEALRIHAAARGGFNEAVRPLYPPDSLRLKMSFADGISNTEELKPVIELLAKRIAQGLSNRESQGTTLQIRIHFEERSIELKRTFSNPVRTVRNAYSALTRMLGDLKGSIYAIEVRMPELKKAKERQTGLFSSRVPGDDTAVERAVERVRGVFGDRSVIKASEKVEPRRVKVLRAWSHATGWK